MPMARCVRSIADATGNVERMRGYEEFQDDQFSSARDFGYNGGAQKTLIIASSERSGSHLLGQSLGVTGCFGDPLEYMQPTHIKRWKDILGAGSAREAMHALQDRRTSPNGVFAIKMHYSHLRALGGMRALKDVFPGPHFVVLRRRNTLKQAVSYAVARESGLWIADAPDSESLSYRGDLIEWALAYSLREHANWRFDVLNSGLPMLDVDHEDVIADVPAAIDQIARFTGVDVPSEEIPEAPVTRKQSSTINGEWLARYLREVSARPSAGIPAEKTGVAKAAHRLRSRLRGTRVGTIIRALRGSSP